jgi:hypothetical protein
MTISVFKDGIPSSMPRQRLPSDFPSRPLDPGAPSGASPTLASRPHSRAALTAVCQEHSSKVNIWTEHEHALERCYIAPLSGFCPYPSAPAQPAQGIGISARRKHRTHHHGETCSCSDRGGARRTCSRIVLSSSFIVRMRSSFFSALYPSARTKQSAARSRPFAERRAFDELRVRTWTCYPTPCLCWLASAFA